MFSLHQAAAISALRFGQRPTGFAGIDDGADDDAAPLGVEEEKYLPAEFARVTIRRTTGRRCLAARANRMLRRTSHERPEFGKHFASTNVNLPFDLFLVEEKLLRHFDVESYHWTGACSVSVATCE